MNIGAGIMGHRPTKLFIITTGGRIDNTVAWVVLRASAATWGRWTRWLPQNLVTIFTMCYFIGSITNLYVQSGSWAGWNGVGNVVTLLVICAASAFIEFLSWQCRGLSGRMTQVSLMDVLTARRAAGTRAIAGPVVLFSALGLGLSPDADTVTSFVTLFAWMWAIYTVTMGRTLPPRKAKERSWRLSLPRLPRLAPSRS